jgi:hypothetical protein
MISKLLFPSRFKLIGLIIFIPALILGIAYRFFDFGVSFLSVHTNGKNIFSNSIQNFTDEVALTGIITGLLMIAFAREKQEDEFINKIRLESLQWAVLTNYVLLIIATWLVYDASYIDVMMYNMLTVLIFFIIRFHIMLAKNKSTIND